MADALDFLRQDALLTRVKGVPGGHRIVWSAKDVSMIREHIMAMPEKIIRSEPNKAVRHKFLDTDNGAIRRKFAQAGVVRDMQQDDLNFLFPISDAQVDLAGDTINQPGIDCSGFNKNPAVLDCHESME